MHHRAARTAPKKILQLEESSIPGGGMGVYTVKKIPKGVVIGPLEGKIIIRDPRNNTNEPEYDLDGKKVNKEDCSADKGNYWQIPGSDNQYVDLLDKSKANFMAYINCARNNREENLIRYFNETDQKFYFKAKIVIPKYTELLVDYGPEFRKTIGINDNACRYEYEKLVEGAKQKPHIVYRRGRYKMVQFRQWITKEEKTTTADWREFYYDVDMDK
ncbi:hypothetical protein M8J75_003988 [Diaphorina citri]|nr:hypothetical protein M8J75_003988 [Diaphorina citri]